MIVSREIEGCQCRLEVWKERERKLTVEVGNKNLTRVLYCAQHLFQLDYKFVIVILFSLVL